MNKNVCDMRQGNVNVKNVNVKKPAANYHARAPHKSNSYTK